MNTLEEWRAVALASLGLPDDKLLGVLALVEQVPDRGQVREVLEKMRPRLVQLRPPRPITVQRLLFRPVEDLFDPPERYRAKIGRLSRHTTSPCWAIVHAHLEKSLVQRVGNALKKIDSTNHQDLYSVGLPFWQASGAVLSAFLAADDSIGRHRVGSGQVTITEDLRQQLLDIADILDIAGEIEAVKMRLPERPIAGVSQVDAEMLGEVITRLGAQSTRRVQTFVLVILARMTRPGDLLKVFSEVSLPCTTIERTGLLKHVGSNALSGLANEAHDLRNRRDASRDPTAGTVEAEQLVSRLVSLERSLGSLHDRGVKEKVLAARKEIGSYVIDKLVVSADQTDG